MANKKIAVLTATIWCNNTIYSPGQHTEKCLIELAEKSNSDIIHLLEQPTTDEDKTVDYQNAEQSVQPKVEREATDERIIESMSVDEFSSLSGKEQISYINKIEKELSDGDFYEVLNEYLEVSKNTCKKVIEEKLSEYE